MTTLYSRLIFAVMDGCEVLKGYLKDYESLKHQQHDNYFYRRLVRTKVMRNSLTVVLGEFEVKGSNKKFS